MVKYYMVERYAPESGRITAEFRCLSREIALHYAGQRFRHRINKGSRFIVSECWLDIDREHSPKVIWEFK